MKRLMNKTAIITGSGSGIGKEIALTYGREVANVTIVDFNDEGLTQTVNELKEYGVPAIGLKVDVTNENDITKMIEETVKAFGAVDILVNNAGIVDRMQAAANVTDEVWERVMNVNVTAVMRGIRKVLPIFLAQGYGNIINMASIAGLTGGRGGFAYSIPHP